MQTASEQIELDAKKECNSLEISKVKAEFFIKKSTELE